MKSFFTLAQQGTPSSAKTIQTAGAQQTQTSVQVPDTGSAAAGETSKPPKEGFDIMIPALIIMVAMIYFMWRNQKKDQKRRQEMIDGVKTGDKVVTIGGIYGEIVTVKEKTFIVKIADNTRIELMKSAVSSVPAGEEPQK